MSLSMLLVVGLVFYFLFGGFGWRRGYYGGKPYIGLGGFFALVLAILFLTGRLH